MGKFQLATTAIIVQARMSSARLPGKVLRPAQGKPMLTYLLERLARLSHDSPVVVATSTETSDDPVAAYCADTGTRCVRGPLDDVAARFLLAIEETGVDGFARISADSPLIDPAILDRALSLFAETGADLVTNVMPRSFPKGMSVEVIGSDAFRRARAEMTEAGDIEHVTPVFYRHPGDWQIEAFTHDPSLAAINLSVDTPEDFSAFERIVSHMDKPHWSYGLDDILALRARAELAPA